MQKMHLGFSSLVLGRVTFDSWLRTPMEHLPRLSEDLRQVHGQKVFCFTLQHTHCLENCAGALVLLNRGGHGLH